MKRKCRNYKERKVRRRINNDKEKKERLKRGEKK